MITTPHHHLMITTVIMFGVRSLYRSRHPQLAITAGQQAKKKIMCRRLLAKFKMLRR
jgi:hypothetical protein